MATLELVLAALVEQQKQLVQLPQALATAIQALLAGAFHSNTQTRNVPMFTPYEETSEDWSDYEKRLRQHFIAFNVEDPELCKSLFLSWISPKLYQLLAQLAPLKEPSTLTFDEMCSLLTTYYCKQTHVVASRVAFYQCKKRPEQSYRAWAAELQGLSRKCKFVTEVHKESYAHHMVRDAILRSAPDREVRQRALQLVNPTLEDVLTIASTYEITRSAGSQIDSWGDVCDVQSDNTCELHNPNSYEHVAAVQSGTRNYKGKQTVATRRNNNNKENAALPSCPRCFKQHSRDDCPQRWATCHNCKKTGHIASVCRSKMVKVVQEEIEDDSSVYFVNTTLPSTNKLFIDVLIFNHVIKMQVDTGSAATIITAATHAQLGSPPLSKVTRKLRTYNQQQITLLGEIDLTLTYKSVSRTLKVFVVDNTGSENLFGYDAFKLFGFSVEDSVHVVSNEIPYMQLEQLSSEYSSLFAEGIGCATNFAAHITLKSDARPKFFRPRPVPVSLRDAVKQEINRLTAAGVLLPVNASEWAAPLVTVLKPNGSLRLCGDFKVTVNSQCLVDTYPMPKPEELFSKLAGGQYFSKIDLSEAYHQLPLDDASKNFLVVNTPLGLYQYQRLPFGISSAPAIFQRFLEQLLAPVPGCINYQDDIIVTGTNTTEHLSNLRKLFAVLQTAGIKCNYQKSKFFQTSVTYLGFRLSKEGILPLKDDVMAVEEMPRPQNIKDLQAFLGALAYYHKFLPDVAEVAHPLHKLLKKNTPFQWSPACEKSFIKLKDMLKSAPCLATYTPGKMLVLATDASQHGIGAVLSHRYSDGSERPIAYASKTLTETQQRYSQIEKEALAIVYALQKFSVFLYGSKFQLITDHKPLVSLFSPNASIPDKAAHRLQRWALYLSRFHYQIHFRPTSQHANADLFSRLPIGPDPQFDKDEVLCFHVDEAEARAVDGFPIDGEHIAKATKKDPTLSKVLHNIENGWPEKPPGKSSDPLRNYFQIRYRLSARNDVILLATDTVNPRVVIPSTLRKEVLQLLHQGHWGVTRTKNLARRHVYWPGIDSDIAHMVAACKTCAQQAQAPRQSTTPWPQTNRPWERIHIDYAGKFLGTYWLLVIDAHSNFPFVNRIPSPTSEATIHALKKIFALEGLPTTIVSDNGTQFTSSEFTKFCSQNGIQHITSPPFHPQSNGEVERQVRTFKTQMRKLLNSSSSEEALLTFLQSYRFSPTGEHSPAELLHGRQPRTLLHLITPPTANSPAKTSGKYKIGDRVWVRNYGSQPKWVPGKVTHQQGNCLYKVKLAEGVTSRHLDQLRPRVEAPQTTNIEPMDVDIDITPLPTVQTPVTSHPEDNVELPSTTETQRIEPVVPTSSGELSPILGTSKNTRRKTHYRPYAKVPPREFAENSDDDMECSCVRNQNSVQRPNVKVRVQCNSVSRKCYKD